MITAEEEVELTRRIKQGDNLAVNKLVTANLRFVISVAKQYQNKGLTLVDLIQEGNIGLLEAAHKFDETRGFRFISYAVWWIRQSIIRAISEQCRTVRVPMSQIVRVSKINKIFDKFEQLNGYKPSIAELELENDIDFGNVGLTMAALNKSISLESPLKDEDAGCLLDIMADDKADPTDYITNSSDISKGVEYALSKLSYRDRDVLRMTYGIGMHPMSSDEIANRFGIGSERIRQIQHKAIDFLRENCVNELYELL